MPRTPKSPDGEAPKKTARKVAGKPEAEAKTLKKKTSTAKSSKLKVAQAEIVATPVVKATNPTVAAPSVKDVLTMPSLEERIRARAYELYLRRGGRGGSPEQDWFEAAAEVYGESVA